VKAIYVLFFCFLIGLEGSVSAQTTPTKSKSPPKAIRRSYFSDNRKADHLDLFIDSLVKNYLTSPQNSGLSIAIVDTGLTRFYNYGEASKGVNTSSQTIYETGSVTQVVLGLLLSKAIQEKKINPAEDIRHYLPDSCSGLHYHSTPVLVHHLAFHSSGLERNPYNLFRQDPFDSLNPLKNYNEGLFHTYLSQVKPSTMPGQEISYSLMNCAILGYILERIYEKPLNILVKEKIADPLHLVNTGFDIQSKDSAAVGRDWSGELVPHWQFGAVPAAGGLYSNTADLSQLIRYSLGNSEDAKIYARVYKVGKQFANYGCFIKLNSQSDKFYWQNIGTGGFSVFYGVVKESKFGLIILSNSSMNVDHLALPILKYFNLK